MEGILNQIKDIPVFLASAFKTHLLAAVIVLAVFVFVLFFTNKVAHFLRNIFIVAVILGCIYAVYITNFGMMWAGIFSLILLAIVRIILNIIRNVRQDRINKRIEERALAKAEKRRGSWKNKQGYSGQAKPIEDDYVPGEMSSDEIKDVIENDRTDLKPAAVPEDAPSAQTPVPDSEETTPAAEAPVSAAETVTPEDSAKEP